MNKYRQYVEQLKGKRKALESRRKEKFKGLRSATREHKHQLNARVFLQEVAQETQEQLKHRVSELATLALKSIFPDPYEFELILEQKRGQTEARPVLKKDGMEVSPMDATGGGVVDVCAFALRLSLLLMQDNPTKVLVLDEPFRFVSADLQPRVSELLSLLSRDLGMQFIIVTHEEELTDKADKIYHVEQKRRISEVCSPKDKQ